MKSDSRDHWIRENFLSEIAERINYRRQVYRSTSCKYNFRSANKTTVWVKQNSESRRLLPHFSSIRQPYIS